MAELYFNETAKGFVSSATDFSPADLETFFSSDLLPIDLFFLKTTDSFTQSYVDRTADSVTVALGTISPRAVLAAATSFTNLPSTVTATIAVAVTGGTGVNEVQVLEFDPPGVSGTYALTFPSRTIAVSGAITGGLFTTSGPHGLSQNEPFYVSGVSTPSGFNNGDLLYARFITGANSFQPSTMSDSRDWRAFGGSGGTLTTVAHTTQPIPADAPPATVEAALTELPSIGAGQVYVAGTNGKQYFITFLGDKGGFDVPLLSIDSYSFTVKPRLGKTGTFNLNTAEILSAISGNSELDVFLELEAKQSGTSVETLCQIPVKLRADIITVGSTPPTLPSPTTFNLISPDSSSWQISIDDDGILTATKQ